MGRRAVSHDSGGEHERGFGIYRRLLLPSKNYRQRIHQAMISIVSFDGPMEMAAERFFICQRVETPGDYRVGIERYPSPSIGTNRKSNLSLCYPIRG
jgi:hypothetical protein